MEHRCQRRPQQPGGDNHSGHKLSCDGKTHFVSTILFYPSQEIAHWLHVLRYH